MAGAGRTPGHRLRVIGDPALLGVSRDTAPTLDGNGVCAILSDAEPTLRAWLDRHGVGRAVLRPDRYIQGLARTAADLDALTAPACPVR
jgi:3-(3-hydroxy-phenyl)propionate hydroxylase